MYKYNDRMEIGGHAYQVILKDAFTIDNDGESAGLENRSIGVIEICTKSAEGKPCSVDRLNEVWLHEIVHGVNGIYGAKLCEEQIEQIAQGLLQILNQLGFHPIEEV